MRGQMFMVDRLIRSRWAGGHLALRSIPAHDARAKGSAPATCAVARARMLGDMIGAPEEDESLEKVLVVGVGGAGCDIAGKLGHRFGCSVLTVNLTREIDKEKVGSLCLPLELAGGRLSTVAAAVEGAAQRFRQLLAGRQKILLVVGLGGNTGSHAAPVLARIARSSGIRVTAVATLPFAFEVEERAAAQIAVQKLNDEAHTLLLHDHAVEMRAGQHAHESLNHYFEWMMKALSTKLSTSCFGD